MMSSEWWMMKPIAYVLFCAVLAESQGILESQSALLGPGEPVTFVCKNPDIGWYVFERTKVSCKNCPTTGTCDVDGIDKGRIVAFCNETHSFVHINSTQLSDHFKRTSCPSGTRFLRTGTYGGSIQPVGNSRFVLNGESLTLVCNHQWGWVHWLDYRGDEIGYFSPTCRSGFVDKTLNYTCDSNKARGFVQLHFNKITLDDDGKVYGCRKGGGHNSLYKIRVIDSCNSSTCELPNCRCPDDSIPGSLDPQEVPQMVLLSFDDGVNIHNIDYYRKIQNLNLTNPDGCPIGLTFFVSGDNNDYHDVEELYQQGHEIASHSKSHRFPVAWWSRATYNESENEMVGMRDLLTFNSSIPEDKIKGMRVPFRQLDGDSQFQVARDNNFLWDSSMVAKWSQIPIWPFTLDHKVPADYCQISPCPKRRYQGFWEIPLIPWRDSDGRLYGMLDENMRPNTTHEMFNFFLDNFNLHYNTTRASLVISIHATWFTKKGFNLEALLDFLKYLTETKDVWIIPISRSLDWVRNPKNTSSLSEIPSWKCNNDVADTTNITPTSDENSTAETTNITPNSNVENSTAEPTSITMKSKYVLERMDDLNNALIKIHNTSEVSKREIENFVSKVSSLVGENMKDSWKRLERENQSRVASVLKIIEDFGNSVSQKINDTVFIRTENLVFEIQKLNRDKDIQFLVPKGFQPRWEKNCQVFIPAEVLQDKFGANESIVMITVIYRYMEDLLPRSNYTDRVVNSNIVAISLGRKLINLPENINLRFRHLSTGLNRPSCNFWDFDRSPEHGGYWSTEGCEVVDSNSTHTVCSCNHLTNFAILMKPVTYKKNKVLGIITKVGCSISIVSLVVTMIIYKICWKHVTNQDAGRKQSILLINLCVSLIIAFVIFLTLVEKTGNKSACTAIAALIEYFLLVTFFIMMAEGIDMAITLTKVFKSKVSTLRWFIISSWVGPGIIVGLSLIITKAKGFGNKKFCWLTPEYHVHWPFIGTVLIIIVTNIICAVFILKAFLSAQRMVHKDIKERLRACASAICILTPILGFTWIFGVFAVNEEFVFFEYLFAVANSVQGLFIFMAFCIFNKQIRKALWNKDRPVSALLQVFSLSKETSSK